MPLQLKIIKIPQKYARRKTMRNAIKRLLAFVLAAAMVLSLAPASVRAAEVENLALNRPATCSNVDGSVY